MGGELKVGGVSFHLRVFRLNLGSDGLQVIQSDHFELFTGTCNAIGTWAVFGRK